MEGERTYTTKCNIREMKDVNNTLEDIIRNVTSPAFCAMPWKCVTMAVGGKHGPSIKKSLVHFQRTCVNGQNIFDIKVHNCKKVVCDHIICTKKCGTNSSVTALGSHKGPNKRKRRKTKKTPDPDKTLTVAISKVPPGISENKGKGHGLKVQNENCRILKDDVSNEVKKRKKYDRSSIEQTEDKEKPSCTLQIFSEGKAKKLNFHLHPAMEMFLGKALEKIGSNNDKNHGKKHCKLDPPSNLTHVKKSKGSKPKFNEGNNVKLTDSVEEFQIKLPDITVRNSTERISSHAKKHGRKFNRDDNGKSGNLLPTSEEPFYCIPKIACDVSDQQSFPGKRNSYGSNRAHLKGSSYVGEHQTYPEPRNRGGNRIHDRSPIGNGSMTNRKHYQNRTQQGTEQNRSTKSESCSNHRAQGNDRQRNIIGSVLGQWCEFDDITKNRSFKAYRNQGELIDPVEKSHRPSNNGILQKKSTTTCSQHYAKNRRNNSIHEQRSTDKSSRKQQGVTVGKSRSTERSKNERYNNIVKYTQQQSFLNPRQCSEDKTGCSISSVENRNLHRTVDRPYDFSQIHRRMQPHRDRYYSSNKVSNECMSTPMQRVNKNEQKPPLHSSSEKKHKYVAFASGDDFENSSTLKRNGCTQYCENDFLKHKKNDSGAKLFKKSKSIAKDVSFTDVYYVQNERELRKDGTKNTKKFQAEPQKYDSIEDFFSSLDNKNDFGTHNHCKLEEVIDKPPENKHDEVQQDITSKPTMFLNKKNNCEFGKSLERDVSNEHEYVHESVQVTISNGLDETEEKKYLKDGDKLHKLTPGNKIKVIEMSPVMENISSQSSSLNFAEKAKKSINIEGNRNSNDSDFKNLNYCDKQEEKASDVPSVSNIDDFTQTNSFVTQMEKPHFTKNHSIPEKVRQTDKFEAFADSPPKTRLENKKVEKKIPPQKNSFQSGTSGKHHSYKTSKTQIPDGSEEECYFEKQEFYKTFKLQNTSKITEEEKLKNNLEGNVRRVRSENSTVSKKNVVYKKKTAQGKHTVINKTLSIELAKESEYMVVDELSSDLGNRSVETVALCYHHPDYYGCVGSCDHNRDSNYNIYYENESCEEAKISKENDKRPGSDGMSSEEKKEYLCIPSEVAWNYYEGLHVNTCFPFHQYSMNNESHSLRNSNSSRNRFIHPIESANMYRACSKNITEERVVEKSLDDPKDKKDGRPLKLCEDRPIIETLNIEMDPRVKTCWSTMNDPIPKRGVEINNRRIPNPENTKMSTSESNTNDISVYNVYHNSVNAGKKMEFDENTNLLIERNDDIEERSNLKRKKRKISHGGSVKKLYSHAKEYLGFGKHSNTNVVNTVHKNVSPNWTKQNTQNRMKDDVSDEHKFLTEGSMTSCAKIQSNQRKANTEQSNLADLVTCPKPMIHNCQEIRKDDVPKTKTEKSYLLYGRNEEVSPAQEKTNISKSEDDTLVEIKSVYEKYRLYGNDETSTDQVLKMDTHKVNDNEFNILQTDSESNLLVDDDTYYYCESNSQSENDKVKNWVTKSKKNKHIYDKSPTNGSSKLKSNSILLYQSEPSNCQEIKSVHKTLAKEDEVCSRNVCYNKPMIHETIALNSSELKRDVDKFEVKNHYKTHLNSEWKADTKISAHLTESIKNNYNKIKVIIRRNYSTPTDKTKKCGLKQKKSNEEHSQPKDVFASSSSASIVNYEKSSKHNRNRRENSRNVVTSKFSALRKYNPLTRTDSSQNEYVLKKIQPRSWLKSISQKGLKIINRSTTTSRTEQTEMTNTTDPETNREESLEEVEEREHINLVVLKNLGFCSEYSKTECSTNNFSESIVSDRKESLTSHQVTHSSLLSSSTSQSGSWFQDPLADPKTGFTPLLRN